MLQDVCKILPQENFLAIYLVNTSFFFLISVVYDNVTRRISLYIYKCTMYHPIFTVADTTSKRLYRINEIGMLCKMTIRTALFSTILMLYTQIVQILITKRSGANPRISKIGYRAHYCKTRK